MRKQAFILTFIFMVLITIFSTFAFYRYEKNVNTKERDAYIFHEKVVIDAAVKNINSEIVSNLSDCGFIRDTYIRALTKNNQEHDLAGVWIKFADNKVIYDNIRFLDVSGKEILAINYDDKGSEIVGEEKLQDKSTKAYYYEGIKLNRDEYYISALDLNNDHGVIEMPYKPIIRVAQPLYFQDELKGLIVLNYKASQVLDTFVSDMLPSHSDNYYLINHKGDYILNTENKDLEFSFMFTQKDSFATQYPEVFNVIINGHEGSFSLDGKLYYYSHVIHEENMNKVIQKINLSKIDFEEKWYVISVKDATIVPYREWNSFYDFIFDLRRNTLFISFVLFNGLALLFYTYFLNRINHEIFIKYDSMTGAYTRKHGLTIAKERFNIMHTNLHKITLVYMDLNGLKHINDHYGHQKGDEAIRKISQSILKNIRFRQRTYLHEWVLHKLSSNFRKHFSYREDDIFIRLGGDEFLYMCIDVDEINIKKIEERILHEIEKQDVDGYRLSVSAGILVVDVKMDIDFESALNLADKSMYDVKIEYYKQNKEFS